MPSLSEPPWTANKTAPPSRRATRNASIDPSRCAFVHSGRSTKIRFPTRSARNREWASSSNSYDGKNRATFPGTAAAIADMMRHPVVHLRAPLRVQRCEFGVDEQESIRLRERGPVGPDHASTEVDPQEVGVHFRRIERAGHEHARVHPVEHALAQDARVHQPKGELPLVAWDDEPEDADVLLPPPGEEFRDLGQRRGEAAPDRVFAGEGDHLDEVRVSEGAAAAFREPFLDEVEELFLP